MSFVNESHKQFNLFDDLVQMIAVLTYEGHQFINNKVSANYHKNQAKCKHLTLI
jgi:hypothetical protein